MDNKGIKGLVSIVVLNWNGKKYVYDCVKSILSQTYKNYEIIIVDNNSTDESGEKLLQLYENKENFRFILNKENTGFSKGMNIGIDACAGEFLLLLNNDIFLKEDFVEKFVQKLDADKEIDCIHGGAFHWTDGVLTNTLQSGASFLKKRMQGVSLDENKKEIFCFGPHGSFPIIRKSAMMNVVNKSGYAYDEDFGTGWEDTDLWFRLQLFGHKTLYMPTVIAWHVGSASAEGKTQLIKKSREYQTRVLRNRYYVIYKNYTPKMKKRYSIYLFITELLLLPYYLLISPVTLLALKDAKKRFRANLNNMKIKRNIIQSNKINDYDYIKQFFIRF
jgi:GT2 family glycosyltransferase